MNGLFIKYLRVSKQGWDENGNVIWNPVGVIVAESPTNIGWSLCAVNDQFSYKRARTIAMGRLKKHPKRLPPMEMIQFITDTLPDIVRWYESRA
jgi:hypothetical protein